MQGERDEDDSNALTWDQRIFQLIDPGIDISMLEENLRRTPGERLARMIAMAKFIENARKPKP